MTVYFVSARELDLVKIGYAFNPVRRYNHLRVSSPVELTLEGAIAGGYDKEHELHKRFASSRVRGEWFMLTSELQTIIDASTRPEKYTWSSVRLWLKKLEQEDKAFEPVPPAVRQETDRRIQEEFVASATRAGMTQLERLEHAGVIHFPFRAKEPA